jgi:hypothetical protein
MNKTVKKVLIVIGLIISIAIFIFGLLLLGSYLYALHKSDKATKSYLDSPIIEVFMAVAIILGLSGIILFSILL